MARNFWDEVRDNSSAAGWSAADIARAQNVTKQPERAVLKNKSSPLKIVTKVDRSSGRVPPTLAVLGEPVSDSAGQLDPGALRPVTEPPVLVPSGVDDTHHAFPFGAPQTDIDHYLRRYETGQPLPESAFSPGYNRARQYFGGKAFEPQRDDRPVENSVSGGRKFNRATNILLGDHDYATDANLICPAEWKCTPEMVGRIYSQARYAVPGNEGQEPIKSGQSYMVKYPLQNGIDAGWVKSYVGSDGLTISNVTETEHPFFDGWINRNAYQDSKGNWYSITHGKGSSLYGGAAIAGFNQIQGPEIFNDLDKTIARQLYSETHKHLK